MLSVIIIGIVLLAVTICIHAIGSLLWLRRLYKRMNNWNDYLQTGKVLQVFITTASVLFILHLLEVIVWAFSYHFLPIIEITSFEEAIYFSFVNYTTLGYGDIVLSSRWKILGGMEAMNGILISGWSAALLFAMVQQIWKKMKKS